MAKYYVRSNELERIVTAPDKKPFVAARKALQLAEGEEFGSYFYVSEAGFRGPREHKDEVGIKPSSIPDFTFPTENILEGNKDGA